MYPMRGEVWLVELNPVRGHEQAGTRPALVFSVDIFNNGPAGLVVVIPITSKNRDIPLHVDISPPDSGLIVKSYIKCEDMRSVSKDRLTRKLGTVSSNILESVEDRVKILLGL